MSEVSRGIIPLEYLASEELDDDWYNHLEASLAKKTVGGKQMELRQIGGFSLLYGRLRVDKKTGKIGHLNIISNRGDRGTVHETSTEKANGDEGAGATKGPRIGTSSPSDGLVTHENTSTTYKTTFGLSNSLFYNPWRKVELGEKSLKRVIEEAVSKDYSHEQLIEACYDVLSQDTFDKKAADEESDLNMKFRHLQASVFIPPLVTNFIPTSREENDTVGKLYGTRTQTIIALHKSGVLHYYERDIHDSDDLEKAALREQHFEFQLESLQ